MGVIASKTAELPLKFVAHSSDVISIAQGHGWLPGARYTNLRDVRSTKFKGRGFLDVDWRSYDFERHLAAAAATRPLMTVARDVVDITDLEAILREADKLRAFAAIVLVVPKDERMAGKLDKLIPDEFLLAYSVPTAYGRTPIPASSFSRPVHLLGGRPDVQRQLAEELTVFSLDCNRFTLDARYGDFFDGDSFRPHPKGGYRRCIADSLSNINALWADYAPAVCKGTFVHGGIDE